MQIALINRIEKYLFRRGYHVPEVRKMVAGQLVITLLSLVGLFCGEAGLDYFCAVLLGTMNFLALAKVIQQLVFVQRGAVTALMISFYGRLILTALILYGLIALKGASVVALLVGLSTVLINILLWGILHFLGKISKEA